MLRADSVGLRITYYDDATSERIELSAATLANWAAKTGNKMLAVLFGAWWIGAETLLGPADPTADLALCTAERLHEALASTAPDGEVAVLLLDPFGQTTPACWSESPTTRPQCGCTAIS